MVSGTTPDMMERWLRTIETQGTLVKIRAKAKEDGLDGHHIAIIRATQAFGMVKKARNGGKYEVTYELTPKGRAMMVSSDPNQSKLPDNGTEKPKKLG